MWRVVAVLTALVAAVSWQIAGYEAADAGHSTGTKHCLSSPKNCIWVHSSDGPWGSEPLDSQFSFRMRVTRSNAAVGEDWVSSDEAALDAAEKSWAKAVGPGTPSEYFEGGDYPHMLQMDTFVLNCGPQGSPTPYACPTGNALALACRLTLSWVRVCVNSAVNTVQGEVWLNYNSFHGLDASPRSETLAHELGHVFGLDDLAVTDHPDDDCLMIGADFIGTSDPQACDLGAEEPCSDGTDHYGIRCVFKWSRELGDPSYDCADADRSFRVTVNDILISVRSYRKNAGELGYAPDADRPGPGKGSMLVEDILWAVGQYSRNCPYGT
jgi:hypothetical protein